MVSLAENGYLFRDTFLFSFNIINLDSAWYIVVIK